MLFLKYKNENFFHEIAFSILDECHVQIIGEFPVNKTGFDLFNKDNVFLGDYGEYTTICKALDNGAIFSDDGSVYVEPEPPAPPTLEEVQEMKVAEMNAIQQEVIAHGLQVTLSDGNIYPFSLTTNDQISIMGSTAVNGMVVKGTPWHIADESVHCQYYSIY